MRSRLRPLCGLRAARRAVSVPSVFKISVPSVFNPVFIV